jgi:hypothetical protein
LPESPIITILSIVGVTSTTEVEIADDGRTKMTQGRRRPRLMIAPGTSREGPRARWLTARGVRDGSPCLIGGDGRTLEVRVWDRRPAKFVDAFLHPAGVWMVVRVLDGPGNSDARRDAVYIGASPDRSGPCGA